MKTNFIKNAVIAACTLLAFNGMSQTTAMNFTGQDCNGNNVDLFADLDAGKAVMLIFYMPNCGSCPPVATRMQTMANNINANHPGLVKAYSFPYQNSTTCAYSASWVTNNNLPLFTPMDSGAVQVAYYGGFGMPTVVLLGGDNHDVLFTTQDFNNSDTTTMRDLILNTFTAGIEDQATIKELSVFPNPASNLVTVSFNNPVTVDTEIKVVDLSGKTLLSVQREKLANGLVEEELDVTSIPAGNYLIQIHSENGLATQHLSIQR